jgi:hypothetical protein
MPACENFLEHLGIPLRQPISLYDTLVLCKIITMLLDLGLVSYLGSHGSRFDIEHVSKDCSELLVLLPGDWLQVFSQEVGMS